MDQQISLLAKLGIVLIALAVLIGIGFGIFTISKDTANTGISDLTIELEEVSGLNLVEYDQKVVFGSSLMSLLESNKRDECSVLVHTAHMEVGSMVSFNEDRFIAFYDGLPYINYNNIISSKPSGRIDTVTVVGAGEEIEDSLVELYYDLSGVKATGSWCVDENGNVIADQSISALRQEKNIEYIDPNSKFDTLLIRDSNSQVVGVLFTQVIE